MWKYARKMECKMPNLFDVGTVYSNFLQIIKFLPITVLLTVVSALGGLLIGFILAVIRIKRIPVLYQMISIFISAIRGTPILIQLYVTYFGIPIGLKYINYFYDTDFDISGIPSIFFAIIALTLNSAA